MSTQLSNAFQNIADAIREKGVSGTMTPALMPEKIRSIPTGGGEEPEYSEPRVKFMSLGKLVKSYSAEEALALTELPQIPEQEDLVTTGYRNGWNWTLSEMKQYLQQQPLEADFLIDAIYSTPDNRTKIYIEIPKGCAKYFRLYITNSKVENLQIDWGDGSPILTNTSTSLTLYTHNYQNSGLYKISVGLVNSQGDVVNFGHGTSTNNMFGLCNSTSSNAGSYLISSYVKKIYFGITSQVKDYALRNATCLETVLLAYNHYVRYGLFYNCYDLKTVVLPNTTSVMSIGSSAFYSCSTLKYISFPPRLNSIASYGFYQCMSLNQVNIAGIYYSISISSLSFQYCYFNKLLLSTKINSIGQSAFDLIKCVRELTIYPLSSFGAGFKTLIMLQYVKFVGTFTSSIPANAFSGCYSVKTYDFSEVTQVVPLAATTSINLYTDTQIVVPDALYDTWIASTYWSDASIVGHIVKASEADL